MNKKKTLIFLGIFWLVLIGGFVGYKENFLRTGQTVLLKTTPIDPSDLFRGDYIVLRYDVSVIDSRSVYVKNNEFKQGDNVYVTLSTKEKYAVATGLYSKPPKNKLFIKGVLKHIKGNKYYVDYGIEHYFVPEGKGRSLEKLLGRNVGVVVVVDGHGGAMIKALLVDGKEVRY